MEGRANTNPTIRDLKSPPIALVRGFTGKHGWCIVSACNHAPDFVRSRGPPELASQRCPAMVERLSRCR